MYLSNPFFLFQDHFWKSKPETGWNLLKGLHGYEIKMLVDKMPKQICDYVLENSTKILLKLTWIELTKLIIKSTRKLMKSTVQSQIIYNYLWFQQNVNVNNWKGKWNFWNWNLLLFQGSLDSIPSPSPSVKIQIIGGKVYLR